MLDNTKNDKPYLVGRATCIVESMLGAENLPSSFVAKVAVNPLDKLMPHLRTTLRVHENAELVDIMHRIGDMPAGFTVVEQGQFHIGYHHQKCALSS